MNTIELISPLPPDECAARLKATADREGPQAWFGSRPLIGSVTSRSVQLRKRVFIHNSFQTYLVCSLEPCDGGTRLRGEVGLHPLLPVFITVWCVAVGLLGGCIVIACVRSLFVGGGPPLWGAVMPFGMLAFCYCLVRLGRLMARGEDQFLIAFVAEVTEAHAPGATGSVPAPDPTA